LADRDVITSFFAIGDWGAQGSDLQQREVAHGMQEYARAHQIHTSALLFLGDNWYGWLWGGVKSQRWKSHFEQLYPAVAFSDRILWRGI
jgi:hypothetical protein